MANIRQTILMRTDLKFPIGLLAAQVAHLHMEHFRQAMLDSVSNEYKVQLSPDDKEWLVSPYVFVHGVPNFEVLNYYLDIAVRNKVEVTKWTDTVFINPSETQRIVLPNVLIGATLGPTDSDKIKEIIGDLPLL